MDRVKKNILLTGLPGVGKTTLIKKLSEELSDLHPVGFYTEEIREGGVRKGFGLISLDGKIGLLSHMEINSPYRVGKYRIDVKGFEGFLEGISFLNSETRLKMSALSTGRTSLPREVSDHCDRRPDRR